ncbi:MAG: putative membrane protein [Crocinitomicaceae bacterium]|jgi:putative membrane protein
MKNLHTYSILGLVLIHTIGISLFLIDPEAAKLSYIIIAACALLVYLGQGVRTIVPLVIISCGGFIIEWIGVHTGALFGEYCYQSALGFKILGIPLVIGLNWYCIVLASVSISNYLKVNIILKAIIAALLCTFLDVLIEPVAIKFGFWEWNSTEIPLYNYICWFIFSFIFALVALRYLKRPSKTATALFITWAVFFILLNFI